MPPRFNPDEYIGVHERVEQFYTRYPTGKINTAVVEHNFEAGFILMRAEVYRNADDAMPSATGHASEVKGGSGANATSHIENCESSAVGRALMNLGFEVKRQPEATRQPTRPQAVDTRPQPGNGKLVVDTLEAMTILTYDEATLNKWMTKQYGIGSDWRARPAEQIESLLDGLKQLANKQAVSA